MTKGLCILVLLGACAGNRDEGSDTLPKRGERMTDPTIVSAAASCESGEHATKDIGVSVNASDPGGEMNLKSCAATIAGVTVESLIGEFGCHVLVARPCTPGQTFVIDLLVANDTGGFTEASVTLTAH